MKTCKQIANEWNIAERTVNEFCKSGKIPGAVKVGRAWQIPDDAVRPVDGRVSSGKYSKKKNHEVFGYTYIPAEPKKETSLQNQVKPDEVVKTQVPKSKVEQATERLRNNPSSGFMYIKKG